MKISPVQQLQSRPAVHTPAALSFSSALDAARFGATKFGGTESANDHPLMKRILNGDPVVMYHGQHDTSNAHELLEGAIERKTSFEIDGNVVNIKGADGKKRDYFVNAHHPFSYWKSLKRFPGGGNPESLHPARYMERIRESGLFTKFDFKTPAAIEPLGDLANTVPAERQMAHLIYAPLDYRRHPPIWPDQKAELLSERDLDRLRDKIGHDVPVFVSCKGLTEGMLTDKLLADVAKKIKGRAQFVNFNIPNNENIPMEFARRAWEGYGIIPEIKIRSMTELIYWDRLDIPYLGVTDIPHLASKL